MKRTNKKPLLSKKTIGLTFGIPLAFTVLALGLKILIPGEPIEKFECECDKESTEAYASVL